jgi:cyclic beta-1,2-glucan synthetase
MEDAIRVDGQQQAAEQAAVANLISSLRFIGTFDWSEFFESVSLVEQVLQRDPAGVYSQMDFRSRDRYRHAVEELARPTGEAQLLLALKSVERARQAHVRAPDDRGGARRLSPDWRRPPPVRAQRGVAAGSCARSPPVVLCLGTPSYLGTIAAGTALLVALADGYAHGRAGAARRCRGGAADDRAGQRAGDPSAAARSSGR